MSLNSLKIATSGYLKRATKAVLIIAVAGYLNFSDTPVPPSPPTKVRAFSGGGVGTSRHKTERFERILKEDEDILTLIKVFIEWQG